MKRQHPEVRGQDLCRSLGVSRQAHHKQGRRAERVLQGHGTIVELVRGIRSKQPRLGGLKLYNLLTPRISELAAPFGRDQFYELLRREGLVLRKHKRSVRTTMSKHGLPVYPDLIRGMDISAPGQVWVADITYWRVEEGFYFIFLITDACSHKIIGYHVARGMSAEHALTALHMAQRSSSHALRASSTTVTGVNSTASADTYTSSNRQACAQAGPKLPIHGTMPSLNG